MGTITSKKKFSIFRGQIAIKRKFFSILLCTAFLLTAVVPIAATIGNDISASATEGDCVDVCLAAKDASDDSDTGSSSKVTMITKAIEVISSEAKAFESDDDDEKGDDTDPTGSADPMGGGC